MRFPLQTVVTERSQGQRQVALRLATGRGAGSEGGGGGGGFAAGGFGAQFIRQDQILELCPVRFLLRRQRGVRRISIQQPGALQGKLDRFAATMHLPSHQIQSH